MSERTLHPPMLEVPDHIGELSPLERMSYLTPIAMAHVRVSLNGTSRFTPEQWLNPKALPDHLQAQVEAVASLTALFTDGLTKPELRRFITYGMPAILADTVLKQSVSHWGIQIDNNGHNVSDAQNWLHVYGNILNTPEQRELIVQRLKTKNGGDVNNERLLQIQLLQAMSMAETAAGLAFSLSNDPELQEQIVLVGENFKPTIRALMSLTSNTLGVNVTFTQNNHPSECLNNSESLARYVTALLGGVTPLPYDHGDTKVFKLMRRGLMPYRYLGEYAQTPEDLIKRLVDNFSNQENIRPQTILPVFAKRPDRQGLPGVCKILTAGYNPVMYAGMANTNMMTVTGGNKWVTLYNNIRGVAKMGVTTGMFTATISDLFYGGFAKSAEIIGKLYTLEIELAKQNKRLGDHGIDWASPQIMQESDSWQERLIVNKDTFI